MFPGQGFPQGGMPGMFPGGPGAFGLPTGFPGAMMDMTGGGDPSQGGRLVNPPGVYYKTRMCNEFREGRCKRGDACKYAHGEHELRVCVTDPNQPSTAGQERKAMEEKAQPHQGQQGPPEAGGGGAGGSGAAGANNDRRPRGENWKTRLCQEFMATGQCRYGMSCTFAHGLEELRAATAANGPGAGAGSGGNAGPGGGGISRSGGIMVPNKVPPPMPPGMPSLQQQMLMPPITMPLAMAASHMQLPQMSVEAQMQQQQLQQRQPKPPAAPPPSRQPDASGTQAASASSAGGQRGADAARSQGQQQQQQQQQQPPPKREEVTYVDRVRAVCAILKIGNAAAAVEGRPAVQSAALAAVRSGAAFRASPFSDDVEAYLPARASAQQPPAQQQAVVGSAH